MNKRTSPIKPAWDIDKKKKTNRLREVPKQVALFDVANYF